MDIFVEETLDWFPITKADLPHIASLVQAVEYFDDPIHHIGIDDLSRWYQHLEPDFVNAVVGRDRRSNNVVAYGWNRADILDSTARVTLAGTVHPAWRDQKIGTALTAWQIREAKRWAFEHVNLDSLWLGTFVGDDQSGRQRLFEHHGFRPERYYFDMHHMFASVEHPPSPPVVEGIEFVPYRPEFSNEVLELHNLCFAHHAGTNRVSAEQWDAMQAHPGFRQDWSWVARSGNQLVGYALSSADEHAWQMQGFKEGWTDRLGVHPDFRRKGVATGLLSWSMWSFGEAGLDGAGIGVDADSLEGIVSLYRGIGYESAEMVVLLSMTQSASIG